MMNLSKISTRTRRRGALTLELVLIFPILMLLFVLFYQVSVMLLTYHSLQTIVSHAAATASTAETLDDITATIQNGVASWYYAPENLFSTDETKKFQPCTTEEMWKNPETLTFRVLKIDNDGKGQYATTLDKPGTYMVEIRLPKLKSGTINYRLLSQFEGVGAETDTEPAFTVSALAVR